MQKMVDEAVSSKYCGGNVCILEHNNSSQSLRRMWNFKCFDKLCESNTLPGNYMTAKNEKHLEINKIFILTMRAIGKGHSTAEKFLNLMNLHRPLHHSNRRLYTKKLQAAMGTLLKQNLEEVASKLKLYL